MRKVVDKYDNLQDEIDIWDPTLQEGLEDMPWGNEEELERRMNIIGQNGNEGEHYSELDLNQDGVIDENEVIKAQQQIESLQTQLNNGLSSWKENKIKREIDFIKSQLPSDDETKTY